jgi:hypothetical protein
MAIRETTSSSTSESSYAALLEKWMLMPDPNVLMRGASGGGGASGAATAAAPLLPLPVPPTPSAFASTLGRLDIVVTSFSTVLAESGEDLARVVESRVEDVGSRGVTVFAGGLEGCGGALRDWITSTAVGAGALPLSSVTFTAGSARHMETISLSAGTGLGGPCGRTGTDSHGTVFGSRGGSAVTVVAGAATGFEHCGAERGATRCDCGTSCDWMVGGGLLIPLDSDGCRGGAAVVDGAAASKRGELGLFDAVNRCCSFIAVGVMTAPALMLSSGTLLPFDGPFPTSKVSVTLSSFPAVPKSVGEPEMRPEDIAIIPSGHMTCSPPSSAGIFNPLVSIPFPSI